jgi:tetratricopeptide (TPR) repeat protein
MKKNCYFLCILIACALVYAGALYAQGALSRQQCVQMANEHYAKGKEYNQQGDYAKANEEFKKAQDLLAQIEGSGTSGVFASSAKINIAEQPPKAASTAPSVSAIKRGKDGRIKAPAVSEDITRDADNYFRHALEFARKGQVQGAIDAYQKALELTPDNPNLHYNLGIEYLKASKFSEAASEFKKVIELNPKEEDAYYNLGVLYDSYLGDKDTARAYYVKYTKMTRDSEEVKRVRSWIAQIDKEKKELR